MISVIIPTRNRAHLLSSVLESLTRQTLSRERFEVLIIDNGSKDNTVAISQKYSAIFSNIKYFYEPEPGLHVGRHRGMLEATNDILVFADDDIEALPSWLESIQEAFLESDVAMVGGNNLPMFVKPPPQWIQNMWDHPYSSNVRTLAALSILEMGGPIRDFSPFYVWGCNFSIRKQVLLAAGGFHPDGMPNELIRFRGDGETHVSRYVLESGKRCVFHPGATVYHKVMPERMTFEYFRLRGFNQGVSDSYTALRGEDAPILKQHSLFYRAVQWGWQKIYSFYEKLQTDMEVSIALQEMKCGHSDGFAYHQNAYRTDPAVYEWVHRKDYFNQ